MLEEIVSDSISRSSVFSRLNMRIIIVGSFVFGALLRDGMFNEYFRPAPKSELKSGYVGRAFGFPIISDAFLDTSWQLGQDVYAGYIQSKYRSHGGSDVTDYGSLKWASDYCVPLDHTLKVVSGKILNLISSGNLHG
jgi:hypothetical protein